MICNKKKSSDTRALYKKKYSLQICLTGHTRDVGHRKLSSWDQEDIAHCGRIGE